MRFLHAAGPAFAATCALLVVASACGSSPRSSLAGGNSSGAANAAGTAGSGLMLGGGGESLIGTGAGAGTGGGLTGTGDGLSAVEDPCAGDLIEAQRIPLDMYVMLDVSGSMLEATASDAAISKWQAVSSALSAFVKDPASDGIGMGLQVFPIRDPAAPASCKSNADCGTAFGPCFLKTCWNYPGLPCESDADCGQRDACITYGQCAADDHYLCRGDSIGMDCGADPDTQQALGNCTALASSLCLATADCRPATYAAPKAAIAALPGAQAALVKAIDTAMPDPDGLTPSGPALQGAIDQASSWAKAHADHQVVAVLATDGLPTLCEPVGIVEVATLAAAGRKLNPAVSTFVIGVVGPDDTDAPTNLNTIARSGGTTRAFIVDTAGDVQQQFRDALNKIRASGLSCELAVPTADAGKTIDFGQVNVTFDSGTGPKVLINWPDVTGCDDRGGWYYDVKPADGTPKRIIACPATCTAFQKTDTGSVGIKLGCETRTIVK